MSMKRKPGRKLSGDVRRDQIVQAALTAITGKGVGGLTTAVLAREAGVSEANLYRHFRNKEAIYFETIAFVQGRIARNIDEALSGDGTPTAKMKKLFGLQIGLMKNNCGILRFIFSDELHTSEKLREKLLESMYAISSTLTTFIRKAQKTGDFRKELDPKTTSLMFIAMIQGLMLRWSLSGFSFSLAAEGKKMWTNFELCIASGKAAGRALVK